jgi:hypothetical protein
VDEDREDLERMPAAENAKYGTDYGMAMVDPGSTKPVNAHPAWSPRKRGARRVTIFEEPAPA